MWRRNGIEQVAREIRARQRSAREVVAWTLEVVDALNPGLNAFTVVDGDRAMEAAGRVDEALVRGSHVGPLAGIPLAVKDLHHAAGLPTSFGSAALAREVPASDSPLVARLRTAGCIVVGKTNTSELGWKPLTDNPSFGATRHLLDAARSPGGSSGGSAVAIASGMVPLATGSDGGGSIRIPASVCGLPGYKASPGRIASDPGALWPTLSVDGVLTANVADLRSVLPTIDEVGEGAGPAVLPDRVRWSSSLGYADVDPEVLAVCQRFIQRLADAGTELTTSEEVLDEDPLAAWLALTATENRDRIGHLRGTAAWELLDEGLRRQVERFEASGIDASLERAASTRSHVAERLATALEGVDAVLTPTVATAAPALDGRGLLAGRPTAGWVRFTYPCNLAGLPAVTLLAGHTADGWPVGIQVIGRRDSDSRLLGYLDALTELAGSDAMLAPAARSL